MVLAAGLGEQVEQGAPLAVLHASTPERLAQGAAALAGAFGLDDVPAATVPLVLEEVA